MEIHGCDTVIKSNIPVADNLIRLIVQDHWPRMVYEIMTCDDGTTDLFLYKDDTAQRAWDIEGWSDANDKTMIYVIISADSKELSLTIDDERKNQFIVDDLTQFIQRCDGNTQQD